MLPHRSQQPVEPFCFTGASGIYDGFLIQRILAIPIHLCGYATAYLYAYFLIAILLLFDGSLLVCYSKLAKLLHILKSVVVSYRINAIITLYISVKIETPFFNTFLPF